MNYAVIDLGSNSVRLSVYRHTDGGIDKIFNRKEMAGLAGYSAKGILDPAGIRKACSVVNDFKETAYRFVEADNLYLFATASIRNIKNREEAVRIIARETTLTPDVLEGHEEAALGFSGVSNNMNCENGVMIDVGGASTELVLFKEHKAVSFVSLPIGCLNLAVAHVGRIIPKESEWKKIKAEAREQFNGIDWDKEIRCPLMVGTGGTLRAVLKLSGAVFDLPPGQNVLQARHIKEIAELLRDNKENIYHMVYKVTPERLMTISTGLIILLQAIRRFGCETIAVSRFGIREGYLMDRLLTEHEKRESNERRGTD